MIIRGSVTSRKGTNNGWAVVELPTSFKQVRIAQEFENKAKTMPFLSKLFK